MSEFEKSPIENEEVTAEDNESAISDAKGELETEESSKEVLPKKEVSTETQQEQTYVEKATLIVKERLNKIDVQDIKQSSIDFAQYFVRCIKQPDIQISTPVIWYHVVMGLLFVFSVALFAFMLESDALYSFFGTWANITNDFWASTLSKGAHLSLALFMMITVTAIVQKNFLLRDVTFRSVFVEFTSRLSMPTVVLFVASVLAYVKFLPRTTSYLIVYLLLLVILLLPILSVTTSKKRNEEAEMPLLYATLLTLFLIFATLYVVYQLIL